MRQGVAARQRNRTPRAARTDRHGRRGRELAGAVLGGAAALALAGPAAAVPTITGSDADVWNAGSPEVRYVITTDAATRQISWSLQRIGGQGGGAVAPRSGRGPSPVTLTLPGNAEGTFRITARDLLFPVRRTFVVDRTPPAVRIVRPADGATVTQGTAVVAEYTCTGAIRCAGTVASGARLDTSRTGPAALRQGRSSSASGPCAPATPGASSPA